MRPIKVENKDIKDAIQSGYSYIQVGDRKFLLMEVENAEHTENYKVKDPHEEKKLLQALEDDNPLLSEEEINNILGR